MSKARDLVKQIDETLYQVYSPSEEASEPNVSRSKFDAEGIRNIMMSYFIKKDTKDVYNTLRNYINEMPDEWVCEFLRHQGDTVVEPVSEGMTESLTKADFINAHKDTAVFPVKIKIPVNEEISVFALRGKKEGEILFSFDYTGENGYKIKNKTNVKYYPFDTVEDALKEAVKGVKEYYDVKTVKIGEPELR